MAKHIDRQGVRELVGSGAQLVDVLPEKEYAAEHIPGAVSIPLKSLGDEARRRLDPARPVVVYCHDYQWDMSARAASRLETLGFRQVYRYQPGKADWFAAGLPREGMEAGTARVADVAERDVATCTVDERVGEVRDRLRRTGSDLCVVVDSQRIVLGLVEGVSADTPSDTRVEFVMRSNPITFRPNVPAGQLPEYLKAPATRLALVTTSDGVLLGLLRR